MILTGKIRSTRGKTCPSATLSTTNPTWTDPESNPCLRGERPATNRLNHGTATHRILRSVLISTSRPSLFWDIARCRLVARNRHFGTTDLSGRSSSTRKLVPVTSHLHLDLANSPFPSGFRAKILCSFLI
jgi:hypothetical protein